MNGKESDESGVTYHAEKRIRQRIGVPKSAVKKLAVKARNQGVERVETHGSLRRYLDALYHYNPNTTSVYVMSEKIYIFANEALITVLNLPTRYKASAQGLCKRKHDGQ